MQSLQESLQQYYYEEFGTRHPTSLANITKYKSTLKMLPIIPFLNLKEFMVFSALVFFFIVVPILSVPASIGISLYFLLKSIYNLSIALKSLILRDHFGFNDSLIRAKSNLGDGIGFLFSSVFIPLLEIFSPILIITLISRIISSTIARKPINFFYQKHLDRKAEQERLNQERLKTLQRNEMLTLPALYKGLRSHLPPEIQFHIVSFLPDPKKSKQLLDGLIHRDQLEKLKLNKMLILPTLFESLRSHLPPEMQFHIVSFLPDPKKGEQLLDILIRRSKPIKLSPIQNSLNSLWENRNNSPENRESFDNQFGLVARTDEQALPTLQINSLFNSSRTSTKRIDGLFFQPKSELIVIEKPVNRLWEKRHESPENQRAFDEQFGLVSLSR